MAAETRSIARSFLGRGVRTDLAIRAVAAGPIGGRGLEATGADAGRRLLHGSARLLHVRLGRVVAADGVGLEESKLHSLGKRACHLAPGQRVDLELQALARALVRQAQGRDLAGLVVDDRGAEELLVHPIEASPDTVVAEREAEIFLDERWTDAVRLFLLPEARER